MEDNLQKAAVAWWDMTHPEMRGLMLHVPNGGRRSRAEGAKFKAMGVRAGVADLLLLLPRGGRPFLAVELKTSTGRQSESQRSWQELVEGAGARYEVARSLDAFIEVVERYMEGM